MVYFGIQFEGIQFIVAGRHGGRSETWLLHIASTVRKQKERKGSGVKL